MANLISPQPHVPITKDAISVEWYRFIQALLRSLNEANAEIEALKARVTALEGP